MQTDEELVKRHLLGDEDAFPELVQRYRRSIFSLACRSTGNVMEAENIAQEVFARAYAALPRSRSGALFKPWLLTIAINLCRTWARRARRQPFWAGHDVRMDGQVVADALEQVADSAPEPLQQLLADEQTRALEKAVASLPLPYRQAITLRYVNGLSYEEMAAALGLPLNTVRTHLSRAKERLRTGLQQRRERPATSRQAIFSPSLPTSG